jgi:hypothetical protein
MKNGYRHHSLSFNQVIVVPTITHRMARPKTSRQGRRDAGVPMTRLIVEGRLIDADWDALLTEYG